MHLVVAEHFENPQRDGRVPDRVRHQVLAVENDVGVVADADLAQELLVLRVIGKEPGSLVAEGLLAAFAQANRSRDMPLGILIELLAVDDDPLVLVKLVLHLLGVEKEFRIRPLGRGRSGSAGQNHSRQRQ